MSMLDYNEIKPKKVILFNDEPCLVISSHVARTQMRKPTNQTKLKSLISGKTFAQVFQSADNAEEVQIMKKTATYIYKDGKKGEYWFRDPENPKDRFSIAEDKVDESIKWLKEGKDLTVLLFENSEGDEEVIGIEVPIKVDLLVTEAPPNIKGDTATGGYKVITLETGATVNAPLFINTGDIVKINTEDGNYVERAEKG